jgi:hypothetical protein
MFQHRLMLATADTLDELLGRALGDVLLGLVAVASALLQMSREVRECLEC